MRTSRTHREFNPYVFSLKEKHEEGIHENPFCGR